jgi:tetratricopeptide (TPR) repeat protein
VAEAREWFITEYPNALAVAVHQLDRGRSPEIVLNTSEAFARFFTVWGYRPETAELGEIAARAASLCASQAARAQAYRVEGVTAMGEQRNEAAAQHFTRSLELWQQMQDAAEQAGCHNNLGLVYRRLGNLGTAAGHLSQAIALRQAAGDRSRAASALDNLGMVRLAQGQVEEAIRCHRDAAAITRELGDRHRYGLMCLNLCAALLTAGRAGAALATARLSGEICREYGHPLGDGLASQQAGHALAALGRTTEARQAWQRALGLLTGRDADAAAAVSAALARPAGPAPAQQRPGDNSSGAAPAAWPARGR